MATKHALTIRLPEPLYQAARRLAESRGVSVNRLVQEAIAELSRHSTSERLSAAYDILAEDRETYDVEKLLAVQAEALLDE